MRGSLRVLVLFPGVAIAVGCTAPNDDFEVRPLDAAVRDSPIGPEAALDVGKVPDVAVEEDASLDQAPAPDLAIDSTAAGVLGAPCTTGGGCASGFCSDGVCCDTQCEQLCYSCALGAATGTCTAVPAGADPRGLCTAEAPATCGRAGGCDGKGGCLLHGTDTECRPRSCTAGVETSPARCNGVGLCNAGTLMTCSLGSCNGDRCAVGCTATSCPTGFNCISGRCEGSGPVLHWRFDDAPGTTVAMDSSGNGFTGVYRGDSALPMPSDMVPSLIRFPNPRSLFFADAGRPGVQVAVSPLLRPPTVTVSLWYRATTAGSSTELVNCGVDYLVRLGPDHVEFAKRRSSVEGQMYIVAAQRSLAGRHLDGTWHHVAGVVSPTAVSLYLDGALVKSVGNSDPILYRGTDLWVGRLGTISANDFKGHLDDVRIYARDLSQEEITRLSTGQP